MSQGPGSRMTHVEIVEAARALNAWLHSQSIQGPDRMFVVAYFIGFEIVNQGRTPARIEQGYPLATGLIAQYTQEVFAAAKDLGISK